jgi:hypothetical protein
VLQQFVFGEGGEGFVGGDVVHSLGSVGEDARKLGLLGHYFADVNGVRVGSFSPWEVASGFGVSGEDFSLEVLDVE